MKFIIALNPITRIVTRIEESLTAVTVPDGFIKAHGKAVVFSDNYNNCGHGDVYSEMEHENIPGGILNAIDSVKIESDDELLDLTNGMFNQYKSIPLHEVYFFISSIFHTLPVYNAPVPFKQIETFCTEDTFENRVKYFM